MKKNQDRFATEKEREAYKNGRKAANSSIFRVNYPSGSPEQEAYNLGWNECLADKQAAFEAET